MKARKSARAPDPVDRYIPRMPFSSFDIGVRRPFLALWDEVFAEPTELQAECLASLPILGGANALVVAPTSAGKTLVGEVLAVRAACQLGRAIFVVPYKAIAQEKYLQFSERYRDDDLALRTVVSSGDYDEFDERIAAGDYDIAFVVTEKLVQLLTSAPGIMGSCSLIVVDEVQLIRDPNRGPLLEMLLTALKRQAQPPQIVCLSATVGDLNRFDEWLSASVVHSNARPVPLHMQVTADDALEVATRELALDRTVLLFAGTVASVVERARAIAGAREPKTLPPDLIEALSELEDSPTRDDLRALLPRGVAFHSSALSHDERQLVERAYRAGWVQCLVSTTTLAMGVNLPADSVVVETPFRWAGAGNRRLIEVSEWLNCAGRAGRLGLSDLGRAYLCADGANPDDLSRRYTESAPESLESGIPRGRPIGEHVLRAVAIGLGDTLESLVELFRGSYAAMVAYAPREELGALADAVADSIEELVRVGLVSDQPNRGLALTPLGHAVSAASLRVQTVIRFLERLDARPDFATDEGEVLVALADAAEFEEARPFTRPYEERNVGWTRAAVLRFGTAPPGPAVSQRIYKRACMLFDWMQTIPVAELSRDYDVSHGHARDAGETAAWLCRGLRALLSVRQNRPEVDASLRRLTNELHFGVRDPGTDVMRLRLDGIRRDDAVRLMIHPGPFASLAEIAEASLQDFRGAISQPKAIRLQHAILERMSTSYETRVRLVLSRAREAQVSAAAVEQLERYFLAEGQQLDAEVAELFRLPGIDLNAERIVDQPGGEPDVVIHTDSGQIVIGCTRREAKAITWAKAREVLGSTGVRDVRAYVVLGAPEFHPDAIRNAQGLPPEQPLSLLERSVLGHAIIDCLTGASDPSSLLRWLVEGRGLLGNLVAER